MYRYLEETSHHTVSDPRYQCASFNRRIIGVITRASPVSRYGADCTADLQKAYGRPHLRVSDTSSVYLA